MAMQSAIASLLSQLCCLGLKVNFAKSILSPSQRFSFLCTVIDSVQMTATVSAERAMTIQRHAASFEEGTARPRKAFHKLLGIMAAASHATPHATHSVLAEAEGSIHGLASRTHRVMVTRACVSALAQCRDLLWLKQGVILDTAHRRKVVTTDASNKGWGALCKGKPTFCLWSEEESGFNCLEMPAVCQACQFFLPDIRGNHVLVHSDSRSMVSHINHQGDLLSKQLCTLENNLLVWAQNNLRSLKAMHVPGKMNHGAHMLSRNNVTSGEWTLHPLAVQKIW